MLIITIAAFYTRMLIARDLNTLRKLLLARLPAELVFALATLAAIADVHLADLRLSVAA